MKTLFKSFLAGVVLALCIHVAANAVSADITLKGNGREIECDSTQRTATLQAGCVEPSIYNKSAGSVWVNLNGGTVGTTSGSTSIEIKQGVAIKIPKQCTSFNFKTASGTSYLIFTGTP